MIAKGDRYRTSMEHNQALFQFEWEKVLYECEVEQVATTDQT
jgi:hypothetical protein